MNLTSLGSNLGAAKKKQVSTEFTTQEPNGSIRMAMDFLWRKVVLVGQVCCCQLSEISQLYYRVVCWVASHPSHAGLSPNVRAFGHCNASLE